MLFIAQNAVLTGPTDVCLNSLLCVLQGTPALAAAASGAGGVPTAPRSASSDRLRPAKRLHSANSHLTLSYPSSPPRSAVKTSKAPPPLDPDEPENVSKAIAAWRARTDAPKHQLLHHRAHPVLIPHHPPHALPLRRANTSSGASTTSSSPPWTATTSRTRGPTTSRPRSAT